MVSHTGVFSLSPYWITCPVIQTQCDLIPVARTTTIHRLSGISMAMDLVFQLVLLSGTYVSMLRMSLESEVAVWLYSKLWLTFATDIRDELIS